MQQQDASVPQPVFQLVKSRLFLVFFKLNRLTVHMRKHWTWALLVVETLQFLSLVLNDGNYSQLGPYEQQSPWETAKTAWLIDICWSVRFDRYLRTSKEGFRLLIALGSGLFGLLILSGVLLAVCQHSSVLTTLLCKAAKVLLTLLINVLFIPIADSLAFGLRCSLSPAVSCLQDPGYIPVLGYAAALFVFSSLALLCSALYGDFCMVSGGHTAKPHPRFKILRLLAYLEIICFYYFLDITGKALIFLGASLLTGCLLCYVHVQYLPYYSLTVCKVRLAGFTLFTTAILVLLIHQFTIATSQTSSSISYLYFFLSPPLVHISHLLISRKAHSIASLKLQQLTSPFQVEIKSRMLLQSLQQARLRSEHTAEDSLDTDLEELKKEVLVEVETLYREAFRKFPKAEYLYLWSASLQLHNLHNHILALVQCFRGLALANRLDSQCALAYFRHTVEAEYKASMQDDAYEFVCFEKSSVLAQRLDEATTRSQFLFWCELESPVLQFEKLLPVACELAGLITQARSRYDQLLPLSAKSSAGLKLYGAFLQSINGYADLGIRYLQLAESKETSSHPFSYSPASLSFFDPECALLSVSGDFETIGEIRKVSSRASMLLGYAHIEAVGRNISLVIPEPFGSKHDGYMKIFHEIGHYTAINKPNLTLYFLTKPGHLLPALTFIQVVPNESDQPFLLAALKPSPASLLALISPDWLFTACTSDFADRLGLTPTTIRDMKVEDILPELGLGGRELIGTWKEVKIGKLRDTARIDPFSIGKFSAFVLRIQIIPIVQGESEIVAESPATIQPQQVSSDSESESDLSSDSDSFASESPSDAESASRPRKISFKDALPVGHNPLQEDEQEVKIEEFEAISASYSGASDDKPLSASSRGSSMVSTLQFGKGVKDLVAYEQGKIRKQVWRFKAGLLLTILVLISTSVATFQVARTAAGNCQQLSHYISLVGKQRLNAQSLSYYIRMLTLIDAGLFPAINRTHYEDWLAADSDEIHAANRELFQHLSLLDQSSKAIYLQPQVSVWVKAGHSYREGKTGLVEAVGSLAEQALLLSREKRGLDFNNRRVFYIYRNGIGETLRALNESAGAYVKSADAGLKKGKLAAILLILASAVLLILCFSITILPTLHSLLHARSEVWSVFFEIPLYVLHLQRTKCIERARLISDSAHLHLYTPTSYKEEDTTSGEDKSALEERITQREKQVNKSLRLKGLFCKLSPFFVVTLVYFYLIYYTSFEAASEALSQEPRILDLASRRHSLSRSVNHWLLESLLQNHTQFGLKSVLPQGQIYSQPLLQAQRVVDELDQVETLLIYGGEEDSGMLFTSLRSKEHNALLFSNACDLPQQRGAEDCHKVADRVLAQGLHSTIGSYLTIARTLLLRIARGNDLRIDSGDMSLLRALDEHYMYDALQYSVDLYERDYNAAQDSVRLYQDLLIALYTIFSLGFYWVIYRPMVHYLAETAQASWFLCVLLPLEFFEEFKLLTQLVRQRRDRFKWR
jgi:hypothetical protein